MHKLMVLALALASSGCVLQRSFLIDAPTPTAALPGGWNLADVVVRAQASSDVDGAHRDFAPLKSELEERLKHTLAQARAAPTPSDFEVELAVQLDEASALNGWMGLGLGLETGVLLAGAGVGTVVGGPLGTVVGMLVATPLALGVAWAPPSATEFGALEATLVVRRRGGPVVATRHVRSEWKKEFNLYTRHDGLARSTGEAVVALEAQVLDALAQTLRELQSAPPV